MPVEYFEAEPTKKKPPESLLDRVVDTTEHHEHAVKEDDSTPAWNTCISNYDLQEYKRRLETRRWGHGLYVKAITPAMTVLGDATGEVEIRMSYEPAGSSRTLVTIAIFKNGHDCSEELREDILGWLNTIENIRPQQRVSQAQLQRRARSDMFRFFTALGVLVALLWILAAVNTSSNRTAATTQATPTPTPILEKGTPHKAMRGRRR